jgi:hypothetical protein
MTWRGTSSVKFFFLKNNNLHIKTEILIFKNYIISFINLEIFLFTEIYLLDELQNTVPPSSYKSHLFYIGKLALYERWPLLVGTM